MMGANLLCSVCSELTDALVCTLAQMVFGPLYISIGDPATQSIYHSADHSCTVVYGIPIVFYFAVIAISIFFGILVQLASYDTSYKPIKRSLSKYQELKAVLSLNVGILCWPIAHSVFRTQYANL